MWLAPGMFNCRIGGAWPDLRLDSRISLRTRRVEIVPVNQIYRMVYGESCEGRTDGTSESFTKTTEVSWPPWLGRRTAICLFTASG
jgi:hypothetical protein